MAMQQNTNSAKEMFWNIEINKNNKPAMAGIALEICGRKFPVKFGDDINDNEAFSTPRLATDKDVAPGWT